MDRSPDSLNDNVIPFKPKKELTEVISTIGFYEDGTVDLDGIFDVKDLRQILKMLEEN